MGILRRTRIPYSNRLPGGRLGQLLASLLLLLVLYPYLEGGGVRLAILSLLASLVLLAGIYAVGDRKWHIVVGVTLAIPPLVSNLASIFAGSPLGQYVDILGVPFYIFTTALILIHVIRDEEPLGERLCGAVSAYLLLGLTWGKLYTFLETMRPGSFSSGIFTGFESNLTWSDLLYFSYTTLTSTGYGDITPLTSAAQSLALLESVTGVMYVAILIARLAGIYKPRR